MNPKVRNVNTKEFNPPKNKGKRLTAILMGKVLLKKAKTFKTFLILNLNFNSFVPQKEHLHLIFPLAKRPIALNNFPKQSCQQL